MKPKSAQSNAQPTNERSPSPISAHEDEDVMQIEALLSQTDLSHRSQIRQSLRHQLIDHSKQAERLTNIMPYHRVKPLAALFVAVFVLIIAMPTITAFAQGILAEVGIFTVTDEQEHFESEGFDPTTPTATPIPADWADAPRTYQTGSATVHANISVDQAAQLTGFDVVRVPTFVPAGYESVTRSTILDGGNKSVDTTYNKTFVPNAPFDHFSISQTSGDMETTMRVGPQAQVFEVEVNGQPATFIGNADLSNSDGRLANMLLWEEGDYTFVMIAFGLEQADLVAIANSMY